MRALVNDGATASRQEPPCTTPEELAKAVGEMPRIRPPEPAFTAPPRLPAHDVPAGHLRPPARRIARAPTQPVPAPPPPLQSRTGRALKWAVSALLIAALGLGSWQLADALMDRGEVRRHDHTADDRRRRQERRRSQAGQADRHRGRRGVRTPTATAADAGATWTTPTTATAQHVLADALATTTVPDCAPTSSRRRAIVYDLGSAQDVSAASIGLHFAGDHTTVDAVRGRLA